MSDETSTEPDCEAPRNPPKTLIERIADANDPAMALTDALLAGIDDTRSEDAQRVFRVGLSMAKCPRCGCYGCQCTGDHRNREISDQFKAIAEHDHGDEI